MKNLSLLLAGCLPAAAPVDATSPPTRVAAEQAPEASSGQILRARFDRAGRLLEPLVTPLGREANGDRLLVAQWINCYRGGWRNC